MSNRDPLNNSTVQSVIWARAKNPLLFFLVSLAAVFMLPPIQELKETFDKKDKASLLIVPALPPVNTEDEKLKKRFNYVKAAPSTDLETAIISNYNAESKVESNPANSSAELSEKLNKNMPESIVKGIVSEVQFQSFKNPDDLIMVLNESVLNERSYELKNLYKQLDDFNQQESNQLKIQSVALNDWNRVADKLTKSNINSLDNTVENTKFEDKNLQKSPDTAECQNEKLEDIVKCNKQLAFALKKSGLGKIRKELVDKKISDISISRKNNIKEEVKNYFTGKIEEIKNKRNFLEEQVEGVNKKYQKISGNIYKTIKDDQALDEKNKIFGLYVNGNRQAASRSDFQTLEKTFLDDSSTFSAVYKLILLTLTAIFIFALVYLLLIPLNRVFFLTTFTGSLSEQAKGFLQKRESTASSEGLARAVLATITAIGIGTAAIIANPATNPFISKDANYSQSNLNDQNKLLSSLMEPKPYRRDFRNDYSPTANFTNSDFKSDLSNATVASLANNIYSLNDKIESLKEAIKNPGSLGNGGGTTKVEVQDLGLKDLAAVISDFNKQNVGGKLKGIQDTIGDKEKLPTSQPQTLIGGLNDITKNLTAPSPNTGNLYSIIKELDTKLSPLKNISTQIDSIPSTINTVGTNTGKIADSANAISQTVTALAAGDLGKSGKNLPTRIKTLFTGERYLITETSYNALKNIIPNSPGLTPLRNNLDELWKNRSQGLLKREEILNRLKSDPCNVDSEVLKNWQRLILRMTRIGR